MAKLEKTCNYGEVAPSRTNQGSNVVYPKRIEGLVINTPDHSLRARKAMRYVSKVTDQGIVKDTFDCQIRNWEIIFINMDVGLLLQIENKTTNTTTYITLPTGKITTFAWCMEFRKGRFGYNSATNPIVGDSIIFLGGINMPMCYIDDDMTIKNWRVLTNQSETARYVTPIVEDFDMFQNRLGVLMPNALGVASPFDEELGIDTPWIYLSTDNSWDNFRQSSAPTSSIHIKPQNYDNQNYYSIKAFRNMLCVVHSGGLSVIKAGTTTGNESLTQTNLLYYLADEATSLPMKAITFNNLLVYLSVTGLRGRTLLEDPLTHKMEGFDIPTVCQGFRKTPQRFFKKPSMAQMCIYDGDTLYTFSERLITEKGATLFGRTTYLKSDDNLKILTINTRSAVLEIKGERFLVNDTDTDIIGIGIIKNFYATVNVLGHDDQWLELEIDSGLQTVIVLIGNTWYKLIQSGTPNRYLNVYGVLPAEMGDTVQLIPLEGQGVMSLLPPAMRSEFYQWQFDLNGDNVVITGDSVSIAVDTDPIIVTDSEICAYSSSITITLTSTATQYGPTYAQELYLFCDRDVEAVATFNRVPKTMRYIDNELTEYAFTMRFNPNDRSFVLKITPTIGQTNALVIEQVNFLLPQ